MRKNWLILGIVGIGLTLGMLPEKSQGDASGKVEVGRRLFVELKCFACHGRDGRGGVKNPNAKGGIVPTLRGVSETYTARELEKKIRNGVSASEIVRQDPAGIVPPLFMPPWKEVLDRAQVEALGAYLLSLPPEAGEEKW